MYEARAPGGMTLYDALFGASAVNDIFSPVGTVQRMLDFEAALADAEAEVGVIPVGAASAIRRQCRAEQVDVPGLASGAAAAGNLAIPLVQQLGTRVAAVDADAARFVHWGATSQDVIDTALALQLRDALALIAQDLDRLRHVAHRLADRHRSTAVVARTWMQHAVPTTMGLQVAGWVDALDRHVARLEEVRRRDVVLQFGGAGGTLASLDGRGLDVGHALARQLNLPMPSVSWHAHRDRIAAVATALGLLTGTLGKIARDLALQSQTEVAELAEPAAAGRGSSSSMPHKHNPVAAAGALAAAIRIPGLVAGVLSGMVQEHERGLGGWQAEWETIPEIVRLSAGALRHLLDAIDGLNIDPARMLANLEASDGLVYSETVTMALARHLGRPEARRIVDAASHRAMRERKHLRDILAEDRAVSEHLSPNQLAALFGPDSHIAVSQTLIDRVLRQDQRVGGTGG